MATLRHLLAAHAPLLWIDAASARVQVGWLTGETTARWEMSDEEAGIGVFRALQALGRDVRDAGAFVYCEGPGSILGIRTVAMALRTWRVITPQPVFAYFSLAVVAHALARPQARVIADARRDAWHVFRLGDTLRRVPTSELGGDLAMPEHFRRWSPLPGDVARVSYSLPDILPRVADAEVFRAREAPDAFLHEEPSYVTWTPQLHRGPRPS